MPADMLEAREATTPVCYTLHGTAAAARIDRRRSA